MAGGLIQLVTYGTQDIFLTGTPQITWFKMVYRRHTNFSIESIEQQFDGIIDFDREVSSTLDKNGDLLHKLYLEVVLPQVQLEKINLNPDYASPLSTDFTKSFRPDDTEYFEKLNNLGDARATFYTFKVFIEYLMNIYRDIRAQVAQGVDLEVDTDINDQFPEGSFPDDVLSSFETPVPINFNIRKILVNYYQETLGINNQEFENDNSDTLSYNLFTLLIVPSIYSNQFVKIPDVIRESLYLDKILDNFFRVTVNDLFDETEQEEVILELLDIWLQNAQIMYNDLFLLYKNAQEEFNIISSPYVKFAWIERIGHYIASEIEVEIGGKRVDRHYSDWLNIWYELSRNIHIDNVYNKMIGNIKCLTNFDNELKPEYRLYIPLQFWFCRHNGLAIPLVALRYHDVKINVRFSKIEDCCYVDDGYSLFDSLHIEYASIFADYVYLDSAERKRFAQASHEYLIEQVQREVFTDIINVDHKCELDFVHPCKEIIWTIQPNRYIKNQYDNNSMLRKNNYSYSKSGKGNPLISTSIDFNSHVRVNELDGNYFGVTQPYQVHSSSPSDGINLYSFAHEPEKHQPTGSANLSRISFIVFHMLLNELVFTNPDEPVEDHLSGITVTFYTINYNVLRFMSGMAGVAFAGV